MNLFRHLLLLCSLFFTTAVFGQGLPALKAQRDSIKQLKKIKTQEANAFQKQIDSLKNEIAIESGWRLDANVIIGLNISRTSNWVSNVNPNAVTSQFSLSNTLSAHRDTRKSFWKNNSSLNLAWQSLDLDTKDGGMTKLFEDRTTDVLALSSLYGYRFNPAFAISTLGDLNTSMYSFLQTGSLDFSTGITYKPQKVKTLAIVAHMMSYHIAYIDRANNDIDRAFGAKFKASYAYKAPFGLRWSTNLNSFIPYSQPLPENPSLFEFTWINNVSFKFWKYIGLGLNVGLRQADFELNETQWFSTVGLSLGV